MALLNKSEMRQIKPLMPISIFYRHRHAYTGHPIERNGTCPSLCFFLRQFTRFHRPAKNTFDSLHGQFGIIN